MSMNPSDPANFSRRAFLKGASVAAVGGTVGTEFTKGAGLGTKSRDLDKGSHEITLQVNGSTRTLKVETRTTLLDALRDSLDLTGSKKVFV